MMSSPVSRLTEICFIAMLKVKGLYYGFAGLYFAVMFYISEVDCWSAYLQLQLQQHICSSGRLPIPLSQCHSSVTSSYRNLVSG